MSELETKGATSNVGEAFEDFMRAFEAFKETNDERLYALERRGYADPLIEEKLNRIDRALDDNRRVVDELALKSARPPLGASAVRTGAAREHAAAFQAYVRKGEPGRLRDLESKALSVGSDPDGGYLVPDETETAVNRAVKDISPIRAIAGVRQVSGSVYKRPFATSGPDSGWVAETAERLQTNTPTLAELSFPTMELYAMPAATQSLLDDSAVNIDEWLAEEVRIAFAEQESRDAWVNGTSFGEGESAVTWDDAAKDAFLATKSAKPGLLAAMNPHLRAAIIAVVGVLWIWFASIIIAQCTGMTDWSPISGMALITVVLVMMLDRETHTDGRGRAAGV